MLSWSSLSSCDFESNDDVATKSLSFDRLVSFSQWHMAHCSQGGLVSEKISGQQDYSKHEPEGILYHSNSIFY